METQQLPPSQRAQSSQQRARASPPLDPEAGHNGFVDFGPLPELAAATMHPPRLQQAGCCSRLVAGALCCMCLLVVLAGWVELLQLPAVTEARIGLRNRMPRYSPPPPPPRKQLPAILQRYGMVRRGGHRGSTDPATMRAAFPHWRDVDGSLAIEAAVSDLALGLAAVVEQLDPGQAARVVNRILSPPPESVELPAARGEFDKEIEL